MGDERRQIIASVKEALVSGSRLGPACEMMGIGAKTYQRWNKPDNVCDGRPGARREPPNKLSEEERRKLLDAANSPEYEDLPPSKIVPLLADRGEYLASESTFYKVLREEGQLTHRHRSKPPKGSKPRGLLASGPNCVYSWDITYLPTRVKGMFFYLYMVMDIYSRKVVGWQVYERESSELAADLMTDICLREGVKRGEVTLHSDNGGAMKGATLLATLQKLGVVRSTSRPGVSSDNAYSESLFRTLKYVSCYPQQPFEDIVEARRWVEEDMNFYSLPEDLDNSEELTHPGMLVPLLDLPDGTKKAKGARDCVRITGINPQVQHCLDLVMKDESLLRVGKRMEEKVVEVMGCVEPSLSHRRNAPVFLPAEATFFITDENLVVEDSKVVILEGCEIPEGGYEYTFTYKEATLDDNDEWTCPE